MKCHVMIVVVICVLIGCIMISPAYGEYLLSTGVRYDIFSDDRDLESNGFEITIPLGVAYKQKRYSISVETAYSNATAGPVIGYFPVQPLPIPTSPIGFGTDVLVEENETSLSSFTDTLLSASYIYSSPNSSMGVFAGLDINLPTGKERLSERERIAEAGESNDLFEVDNFGDGLNVGLSLGLTRDIGNVSLGVQGAYVYNGEFDPTRNTPDDDLDPGDQILSLALFGWQASSRLTLDAFIAYSYFLADKVNEQETFREGDSVVVGGDIRYERKPVGIAVSLQGTVRGKNEKLVEETLQTESENSNGNDFFGLVDVTYHPFSTFTLRLLGDIRYYGESDFKNEMSGVPYKGERIRYAIGPGFVYSLSEHLSCDSLLKFFLMTQEPDSTLDQEVMFLGINLDVGFTYTF